jgi:hypothetical protein
MNLLQDISQITEWISPVLSVLLIADETPLLEMIRK